MSENLARRTEEVAGQSVRQLNIFISWHASTAQMIPTNGKILTQY